MIEVNRRAFMAFVGGLGVSLGLAPSTVPSVVFKEVPDVQPQGVSYHPTEASKYGLLSFDERTVEKMSVFSNVSHKDSKAAFDKFAVRSGDLLWLKLVTVLNPMVDSPVTIIAGGQMPKFCATHVILCENGVQVEVKKNRQGIDTPIYVPPELHTWQTAMLWPRLNLFTGRELGERTPGRIEVV